MSNTQFLSVNIQDRFFIKGEEILPPSQRHILLIDQESTAASQEPTAVDDPIQVEFGPAASDPGGFVSLANDGSLTILQAGTYQITAFFRFGRTGASGTSILLGQLLVNGVAPPEFQALAFRIDNPNFVSISSIQFTAKFPANAVLTFEIARDSAGINQGGLFRFVPTTLPWNPSPSAGIRVSLIEVSP